MKRLLRRKWIKVICGILAAVSLSVTVYAAIIFGICMDRGFGVTNSLKIGGEDVGFKEKEIEYLAEKNRAEVIYTAYQCLVYDIRGNYQEYMDRYSKENSNYYFSIKPKDNKYPELSNYYEKEYQYKNTGTYSINYYENLEYTYPYSRDKLAEEWIKSYIATYGNYEYSTDTSVSNGDIIENTSILKARIIENMTVDVWSDNTIVVSVDEYAIDGYSHTCYIDLSSDREFVENNKAFELENISDENTLQWEYAEYNMFDEQIECQYTLVSKIDLEYTEYVRKELTAHDDFYYSPFLKYGDIIENYTVPILIVGGIVLLVSSVLLCMAAGRRNDREDVVCGSMEKIPLEILIFIYMAAAALFCLMLEVAADDGVSVLGVIGAVTMACIMFLMYPVFLSTMAVRIKSKLLLKNTLIYRIFRGIKKCISYLWKNIHIYGKVLGIYVAIIFIKQLIIVSDGVLEPVSWIVIWLTDILIGVFIVMAVISMNGLKKGALEIAKGNTEYKIDTSHMLSEFKQHGETLNNIGDGIQAAVEERIKSERMKTELITNVSHDIKTPITSIISYVDLLDKENIENEKANEYIEVLKRQSERLKKLVQDLIDASKASTGNMPVNIEQVNINVMLEQIIGESMEKLLSRNIKPVVKYGSESAIASADGRLLYRSIDNLIQNIYKYAMENSRVYIDVEESSSHISVTLKNISQNELNVSGDELMERFVRGDSSRNTEGSGLGLSIAKSLMEIQGGSLKVVIDGDLFKAVVIIKKFLE